MPGESVNRIGIKVGDHDGEDFVIMTDILLKDVTLPFRLRSAIERKLEQAQISQEYGFRIQRERLESERKQIEAQGIQAFQQTVQAGISEAYLKWRGIEATLQLAASPNAKVVIVGGGSQGLPLILNTGDTPTVPSTPPAGPATPHPVKLQKADVDGQSAGRIAGSIDMSPPQTNSPFETLANPRGTSEEAEIEAEALDARGRDGGSRKIRCDGGLLRPLPSQCRKMSPVLMRRPIFSARSRMHSAIG